METATLCKTKRGALLSYKENKFALFDPDLGVIDIHREPTAGDAKDGGVIEEGWEFLSVQRRAADEELQVGPEPGDVLHQTEEDVRVQRPLVCFVCNVCWSFNVQVQRPQDKGLTCNVDSLSISIIARRWL